MFRCYIVTRTIFPWLTALYPLSTWWIFITMNSGKQLKTLHCFYSTISQTTNLFIYIFLSKMDILRN